MANLDSSRKDVRRIKRRHARNVPQKSRLRNLAKKVYGLTAMGEFDEAEEALNLYYKHLDRASRQNLIPPRRACRYKSNTAKFLYQARQKG